MKMLRRRPAMSRRGLVIRPKLGARSVEAGEGNQHHCKTKSQFIALLWADTTSTTGPQGNPMVHEHPARNPVPGHLSKATALWNRA